jgi:undecaprenyl-diphosphatase
MIADTDDISRLESDLERPPGERYYRHPGDVVRLVIWGAASVLVILFIQVATDTSDGVTTDLARAGARLARPIRVLLLALCQVAAIVVPVGVLGGLMVRQRWRRTGVVVLAAIAGAACFALLDGLLDLPGKVAGAVDSGTWLASTRFPNLEYLAGAAAAATVGKPWLARPWRRSTDLVLIALGLVIAITGGAGVPEVLLAGAVGAAIGAAVLVVLGAPNRRPSPASVLAALRDAGFDANELTLERASGGRSQLYRGATVSGERLFVKVYSQDSRDADLLYRGYRKLLLRGPNGDWPSPSLERDVEHEALLLLLTHTAGVACPALKALTALGDGSMALAMEDVGGQRLDSLSPDEIDADLLDAVWREVSLKDNARIAHGALRAANVLVADHRPILIDLGAGDQSADARLQAVDRAELLVSLATLVGPEQAVASATRVLTPGDLAAATAFLQPLALSKATRKPASKSLLRGLRDAIATSTSQEPQPLERLIRVRPKTVITIAALAGAFYILLPQLANVGDSFRALRSANWWWLAVCVVMSLGTYIASAIGLGGGIHENLPFGPTVEVQMASSFVNRVTPANVGGMALNVRYMQKAGVDPAEAVTGMGLNVIAGGVIHIGLLFVFVAWAGQKGSTGFHLPGSSKLLVIVVVLLAVVGIVIATRRGRRLARRHVLGFLRRSWSSITSLARSPLKLAALFGGSALVTLFYIAGLAAAVAAFDGGASFAQVGAVYLGSSIVAAAAPTPGGLGAMEAALVAGFSAIKMDPGVAVAAVLSYRLATYWLPILPGWLSYHHLERQNLI